MAVRYATIKPFPIRDQLSFHKCQVMQRNGSNPSCPTARPGTTARLSPIQALSPPPPRGHTRTTRHGGPGTGLPTGWSDLSSWGAPRAFACAGNQFAGFREHLFEAIRKPFGKQTPITTTVSAGGISVLCGGGGLMDQRCCSGGQRSVAMAEGERWVRRHCRCEFPV